MERHRATHVRTWNSQLSLIHCFYVYFDFRQMQREYVWAFLLLAAINISLVVYHLYAWKDLASDETFGTKRLEAPKTPWERAKAFKANFDINGKWFLVKLYSSEVLNSCTQVYNTAAIYLCALPPGVVLLLCFTFCDHGYRLRKCMETEHYTQS